MTDIRSIMLELVKDYSLAEIKEAAVRASLEQWGLVAACRHLDIDAAQMYRLIAKYQINHRNGQARLQFSDSKPNRV